MYLRKYKVAAIQLDTKNNKPDNLRKACGFIEKASAEGAKLICFPENMNLFSA